jgi:hypothetical protein
MGVALASSWLAHYLWGMPTGFPVKMGRCILAYAKPGNLILTASAS